jgi:hypothetical protein
MRYYFILLDLKVNNMIDYFLKLKMHSQALFLVIIAGLLLSV